MTRVVRQCPWSLTALVPNGRVAWKMVIRIQGKWPGYVTLPIQMRCSDLAGEGKASQPWTMRRGEDEPKRPRAPS